MNPQGSNAVAGRFRWKLLIAALSIVSLSLLAYAILTSTDHQITEPVVSSGGDTLSSPSYNLLASVGQTGTDTLASASYMLNTGLYYFRRTPGVVGTVGDSLVIVGDAHQVVQSGASATLVMDVKDSSTGGLVANASVNFTVDYEGAQVSSDTAAADTAGRVVKSVTLSSGDGAYVITAARGAGKTAFVVMTDKRRVPAHPTESPKSKWVMIAPMKKPDATKTGLTQLSYGGTPISYSYDPAKDAGAPWYGYISVSDQPSADNVSPKGTFSQYQSGKAYWFRSSAATSVGLAGTPTAVTETYSVRIDTGANMIGSPFTHFIDWLDDVAVDTNLNDTPGPIRLRNLTPAQMSKTLDTRVQWRSQTAEQYVNPFAASETTVQMKPWVGFWVKANASCSVVYYPTKRLPQTKDTVVKQQAPAYSQADKADASSWRMRLMAYSDVSEIRDEYTFLGVAPSASDGEDANDLWKAPGLFGDLQVWVGEAVSGGSGAPVSAGAGEKYYAASIAPPVKTATVWPVVVTPPPGLKSATLKWEAGGLPEGYEAYIIGGPAGPVNMRTVPAMSVAFASPAKLTVVVGTPEYLSAFLAAPLSKENTFVYPNPGPDATGNVTFKYNLQAAGDVQLKIFDVGGKLVKELAASGAAGSNNLTWDTTNKHGQKLGSGVYIYILQAGGNKLVDKLAVIR